MAKLWDGRFSEKTDELVEAFTASIDVDRRLYACDIAGSIAHARMLAKVGVIASEEADALEAGLREIRSEIEAGRFAFDPALEDIHMNIEDQLQKKLGAVARKLHTARSRNDQVALDVRMFLKDETQKIIHGLDALRKTLIDIAKANLDVILPGYTHLQRAQPVLFSHHMMAYYEMFSRDAERFRDGLKRTDVMPLGCAALAGTTYPIDREYTAELLQFSRIAANSIDAVADRDFIIEFLAAASMCMMHFSRLSEELVLWSSAEFRFIDLPDAFATGSSIMPQKKNPDIPELVRGKTGRVFGNLVSLLTMMKALPLAYNRDMQEDKIPLFETVDILASCIEIYVRMLPKLKINKDVMLRAASTGFLNATDLADYLAARGLPFREAHECAGKAVGYALGRNKELHDLSLDELKTFSSLFSDDVYEVLTPEAMVRRRTSQGGAAPEQVMAAIETAEQQMREAQCG